MVSGWVLCTHCYKLTGAAVPVAPALTEGLTYTFPRGYTLCNFSHKFANFLDQFEYKQTTKYLLLKRRFARSIVHAHVCVKTPKSIVKSYKEHSLKVSAQSDHKHKRYSTLMILMQILELFFILSHCGFLR